MELKLTPRTWLALVTIGPAIYLAIAALPLLVSVFLLLLVTCMLALLITPVADAMERRGFARGLTTGLVLFGVLALLAGLVLMLVPVLLNSLQRLAGAVEGVTAQLPSDLGALPQLPPWLSSALQVPDLGSLVADGLRQALEAIRLAAGQIGGMLGQIGAFGFAAFVSFAVVFALVGNKASAPALMRLLLPERFHVRAVSLTRAVSAGLSRWFVAQLAICGYYVVAYTLTLTVFGAPYALQIGVVSGLLEFIPYLGGIVGMVLSVLAASTVGWPAVLGVLAVEAVIGSLCVYFVAPYAFSKAVDVPPALVLFGLFVGGLVGGFFAALLTVPLLAAGLVVLRELRPDLRPEEPASAPKPKARTTKP